MFSKVREGLNHPIFFLFSTEACWLLFRLSGQLGGSERSAKAIVENWNKDFPETLVQVLNYVLTCISRAWNVSVARTVVRTYFAHRRASHT